MPHRATAAPRLSWAERAEEVRLWPLTLFVLAAVCAQAATTLPKLDDAKLPYRAHWGRYTVRIVPTGKEEYAPKRLLIQDARGRTLREIRDARFLDVKLRQLNRAGLPELWISSFTGGAHCCFTDYFFTQDGGLRNLFIFDGGNGEIEEAKDLDGDGRPEFVVHYDVLAYFNGLSYAGSPGIVGVVGWDGRRWTDRTRRFPDRTRKAALDYRKSLEEGRDKKEEFAEEERHANALGYYANARMIGEGAAAWEWLQQHAPEATRDWLRKNRKDADAAIDACPGKVRVSQARLLKPHE